MRRRAAADVGASFNRLAIDGHLGARLYPEAITNLNLFQPECTNRTGC